MHPTYALGCGALENMVTGLKCTLLAVNKLLTIVHTQNAAAVGPGLCTLYMRRLRQKRVLILSKQTSGTLGSLVEQRYLHSCVIVVITKGCAIPHQQ